MSRIIVVQFILVVILSVLISTGAFAASSSPGYLVVIDPGHGGRDQGAVFKQGSRKILEKDVTLLLAQSIALQLQSKGIRSVLTREKDQEVPLADRTALANRLGADLFVSIHMNSTSHKIKRHDPSGFETFFLNTSTDESSKRLARFENSVLEDSVADELPHGEENDVALILKDLILDANLTQSKQLACEIQGHLVKSARTRYSGKTDRGVKQALFYVLLGADMPSVLVEAGFLNHDGDRRRILNRVGRIRTASAISDAIVSYRNSQQSQLAQKSGPDCKVR